MIISQRVQTKLTSLKKGNLAGNKDISWAVRKKNILVELPDSSPAYNIRGIPTVNIERDILGTHLGILGTPPRRRTPRRSTFPASRLGKPSPLSTFKQHHQRAI
jgi:hypothetical protein